MEAVYFSDGKFWQPVYPDVYFTWPVGSLFFTMTVFTTIGYGVYAPTNESGKLLMVPMALIGLCVTSVAITSFLTLFQYITDRLVSINPTCCGRFGKVLSITAVMMFLTSLLVEALKRYENWEDWESWYFAWVTMTTIGFGDYCPRTEEGRVLTILLAILFVGLFPLWADSIRDCMKEICSRNSCYYFNLTNKRQPAAHLVKLHIPVTELSFYGEEGYVWAITVDGDKFRVRRSWIVEAADELVSAMQYTLNKDWKEMIVRPEKKDNIEFIVRIKTIYVA